jgi:hypothetical protein
VLFPKVLNEFRLNLVLEAALQVEVMWYVEARRLPGSDRRFVDVYCLSAHSRDDEGSKHLRNVRHFPSDYTM